MGPAPAIASRNGKTPKEASSSSSSPPPSAAAAAAHGWSGPSAALGSPPTSLALYRITLGTVLLAELVLRFAYLHPFYADDGTLPIRILDAEIDPLYRAVCLHCHSGSLAYQRTLLGVQCLSAFCLTVGYQTRLAAVTSWFLYLSLTLRNTWLSFILDRYFHYLTFYGMLLPLGEVWSVDSYLRHRRRRRRRRQQKDDTSSLDKDGMQTNDRPNNSSSTIVTAATIALKVQILWIYLDAGYGKYTDPLQGWTYSASPLPALDTYARHTIAARYMYAILGPAGLRVLTPMVVYVELGVAPLAFLGSALGWKRSVWTVVGIVWALHLGIAATIRNTVLLSLVANCAWCVFLPPLGEDKAGDGGGSSSASGGTSSQSGGQVRVDRGDSVPAGGARRSLVHQLPSLALISCFVCGSVWFETMSGECNQSMKHIWSTLLHNRWNVFVGAEEYVTWEIAPGRLQDGTIVDVWAKTDYVDWDMPGSGTPCTSTARGGRWRSYPYLAGLEGEAGHVLWQYLCDDWDRSNGVFGKDNGVGGRKLLRFNFFMLQADVLPEMGFSATRKRLIHSHDCTLGFGDGDGDDFEGDGDEGGDPVHAEL